MVISLNSDLSVARHELRPLLPLRTLVSIVKGRLVGRPAALLVAVPEGGQTNALFQVGHPVHRQVDHSGQRTWRTRMCLPNRQVIRPHMAEVIIIIINRQQEEAVSVMVSPDQPERSPMSSITTHPDQASRRLLISSQMDSLLLLVIWERNKDNSLFCIQSLHSFQLQYGGGSCTLLLLLGLVILPEHIQNSVNKMLPVN